jgi:endonuclease YncB( thermonuclease family)
MFFKEIAIVFDVIDGDTIKIIKNKNEKPVKIRLSCIDAPELTQSWGIEAKAHLK